MEKQPWHTEIPEHAREYKGYSYWAERYNDMWIAYAQLGPFTICHEVTAGQKYTETMVQAKQWIDRETEEQGRYLLRGAR